MKLGKWLPAAESVVALILSMMMMSLGVPSRVE